MTKTTQTTATLGKELAASVDVDADLTKEELTAEVHTLVTEGIRQAKAEPEVQGTTRAPWDSQVDAATNAAREKLKTSVATKALKYQESVVMALLVLSTTLGYKMEEARRIISKALDFIPAVNYSSQDGQDPFMCLATYYDAHEDLDAESKIEVLMSKLEDQTRLFAYKPGEGDRQLEEVIKTLNEIRAAGGDDHLKTKLNKITKTLQSDITEGPMGKALAASNAASRHNA